MFMTMLYRAGSADPVPCRLAALPAEDLHVLQHCELQFGMCLTRSAEEVICIFIYSGEGIRPTTACYLGELRHVIMVGFSSTGPGCPRVYFQAGLLVQAHAKT